MALRGACSSPTTFFASTRRRDKGTEPAFWDGLLGRRHDLDVVAIRIFESGEDREPMVERRCRLHTLGDEALVGRLDIAASDHPRIRVRRSRSGLVRLAGVSGLHPAAGGGGRGERSHRPRSRRAGRPGGLISALAIRRAPNGRSALLPAERSGRCEGQLSWSSQRHTSSSTPWSGSAMVAVRVNPQ